MSCNRHLVLDFRFYHVKQSESEMVRLMFYPFEEIWSGPSLDAAHLYLGDIPAGLDGEILLGLIPCLFPSQST